jgi:hypothetical protein
MTAIPKKVLIRLSNGIKKFQNILKSAKAKDINESDTVTIVIDMLAELFGYEKFSEITTELAISKTYCDLAIKIDSEVKFLIEVKAIGIDLKTDHIRQVVNYGSNKGTDWVILTNGNSWKIFKISFGKPIKSDLIYEFEFGMLNPKIANDIEYLYYISRESISRSVLEEYLVEKQILNRFFIGQILLTQPILDSIRKTIKRVCPDIKVTASEVEEILSQEIIRREILDDEKANDAKKRINKKLKAATKIESSTISKPVISDQPILN